MTRKELKELIWSIYKKMIENEELGYQYFIDTNNGIPDQWYEVYCIELERMCIVYLSSNENTTTSTKSIAFHEILIYLRNDIKKINPLLKLEFREKPKINCNSVVKYFKLLQEEDVILNSNEDLSKILNYITKFEYGTISSNINDRGKLKRIKPLLPSGYVKQK
jgi:hypothetical protein